MTGGESFAKRKDETASHADQRTSMALRPCHGLTLTATPHHQSSPFIANLRSLSGGLPMRPASASASTVDQARGVKAHNVGVACSRWIFPRRRAFLSQFPEHAMLVS
jgi:hypothetical protein